MKESTILLFFFLCDISVSFSQDKEVLFFREDWKETDPVIPITQDHVANSNLVLSLHGPGKNKIKKSNHPNIPNDPFYIWSGECLNNWALSLKHQTQIVDLTGPALVRWRSKQSGFRRLHLILKLADDNWLISDQYDDQADQWQVMEFEISDLRWRNLDIKSVIEGDWVDHPDLSEVEEIGFTDLMVGGRSKASSRVDWIEVYGKPKKR
jgi:hypothetical protein